jgi:hypothetical protein
VPQVSKSARSRPAYWAHWLGPALILLAAAIAAAPIWAHGPVGADDFEFHFISWLDAQHSWLNGIPYPHWAPSPNFGAGEPRFVFYPPLTWMLGAALGLVLPWTLVPFAMTFLLLAATGLATRTLARRARRSSPATPCSPPTTAPPSESWPAASGFRRCCGSLYATTTLRPASRVAPSTAAPLPWRWCWRAAGSPMRRSV